MFSSARGLMCQPVNNRMATVKSVAGAFSGGVLARFATVANQASANNLKQVPTSGTRCKSLFCDLINTGVFNLLSMPLFILAINQ